MLIEDKKDYSLQLFGKVEHGFALRGNQDDPYEREFYSPALKEGSVASLAVTCTFTDNSQVGSRSRV